MVLKVKYLREIHLLLYNFHLIESKSLRDCLGSLEDRTLTVDRSPNPIILQHKRIAKGSTFPIKLLRLNTKTIVRR